MFRRNHLGGTVVHRHVYPKHCRRNLRSSHDCHPDCEHLLVLAPPGIILCMAGRVMAKLAALKLDIGFVHNKSEHALTSSTLAHQTFIYRIMAAARDAASNALAPSSIIQDRLAWGGLLFCIYWRASSATSTHKPFQPIRPSAIA